MTRAKDPAEGGRIAVSKFGESLKTLSQRDGRSVLTMQRPDIPFPGREHHVVTRQNEIDDLYRAGCVHCPFCGPGRETIEEAVADANEHVGDPDRDRWFTEPQR